VVLAVVHVGAATNERRITNASNVRLRSAPANSASIEAELPLGTALVALEHTNAAEPWYHVKTDDGHEGWLLGSFTIPLDPSYVSGVHEKHRDTAAADDIISLDPLLAAVTASTSARKTDALAAIERFAQLCR
jgi:Bacterial SH3 domain